MKKRKNNRALVTMLAFGAAAAFTLIVGIVYEQFSHGVYSPYMYLAFLVPLAGGVIPYLLILLTKAAYPPRVSVNLHASGIATLTVGSIMQGALEIYGTTNRLMIIYLIAGAVLTFSGILTFFLSLAEQKTDRKTL